MKIGRLLVRLVVGGLSMGTARRNCSAGSAAPDRTGPSR